MASSDLAPACEAVEVPPTDVAEEVKVDDKPAKASKVKKTTKTSKAPKAPKEKKTKSPKTAKPAAHPPYLQMIVEAISALKDRTGSSNQAIAKFLEDKYKTGLPSNFKKMLSLQLKKFSQKGKLVMVKHSYKLSVPLKKPVVTGKAPAAGKKVKAAGRPKGSKNKAPKSPKAKAIKAVKAVKDVKPKAVKVAKPKAAKALKAPKAVKAPSAKVAPKKVAKPVAPKKAVAPKKSPKKVAPKKVAAKKPKSVKVAKKSPAKKAPAAKKAKIAAK